MPKFLVFLFIILPFSCFAQYTISGRILNYADKKPIASADVFINNATSGTASGSNGEFKLNGVKPGRYYIIVSIVGYNDFSEPVQVNGDIRLNDIYLTVSNKTLNEVVVKPTEIPTDLMYNFKQQFLGKSDIAQDCKILNPEVLDINFDRVTRLLTASSSGEYLIIENPDLGYRIKYKLADFAYRDTIAPMVKYSGHVRFEQMDGKPADMRRWEKARYEAYKNSAMHFYRALLADRLDEEGFKAEQYIVFQNPYRPADSIIKKKIEHYKFLLTKDDTPVRDTLKYWERELKQPLIFRELRTYSLEQQDLLRATNQPGLFALGCDTDKLFIIYNDKGHFDNFKLDHVANPKNTECTLISFNSAFGFIDRNGVLANPYDVSYMGVWANERVADLLPVDYNPPDQGTSEPVDSTASKKVIAALTNYTTNHAVEKAYLHFDKPYYAAGDTMYFKAYVTVGDKHEPSNLSNVLHVDLVDGNGNINKSTKLAISGGIAWGDLTLPDSLPGGRYRVRAYTEWMRNDGSAGFFDKIIPVAAVTTVKSAVKTSSVILAPSKPDIQFFPEGGSLVAGVKTRIAFKAIGVNGLGITVKGDITDETNNKIGSFASVHKGMGYFYISPETGKTYKAGVTFENGVQETITLPAANDKGITLAVNNDSTMKIAVKIIAGQDYFQANKGKDLTLIVYSGGTVTNIICKLDKPIVPVDVFKRSMRSGIARITLFSPNGEPLSERLAFVQNFDGLKLKINSDKIKYNVQDKVSMKLNVLNDDGEPTAGDFSVSVTDENKVPVDVNDENTILTSLLLTSDLKGYVEQPNYYFANPTPEVLGNLDILMLTQGYRGFEWKDVFDVNKPIVNYPAETSLSLSGTVKTMNDKPVNDGHITLLSTKLAIAKDTTTDDKGNFKFTGLFVTDTTKLVLHGTLKNNSAKVKIDISKPDIPVVAKLSNTDTSAGPITPAMAEAMRKRYEQSGSMKSGIVLKQVNVKSNVYHSATPVLTHSANLNGPGNADQVYTGDQLVGCPDVRECLKALLRGVYIENGVFYNERTHVEILTGKRQPMVFIVDGLVSAQTDGTGQDILNNLAAQDIYSVEVLLSTSYLSIYGANASAGAIIITTRHGGESAVVQADGSVVYTFHGFEKARTFYSPKYDVAVTASNHPDQRSTIYWQPELTTDDTGSAGFDFFNATDPGTYRVVVEGMDGKGNLGRYVYYYYVGK